MLTLPLITVAPNGARRTKLDHSNLPMTIPEIVATAVDCWDAGASGLHLHVRDDLGKHTLDAGIYREALAELKHVVPNMLIQITTEAVGLYSPEQQRQVVRDVKPNAVSISIAEMFADSDDQLAIDFYRWCDESHIAVQHIIYNVDDLHSLSQLTKQYALKYTQLQLLFVLGRYTKNQQSNPNDLLEFTDWLNVTDIEADWAVCAFGQSETDCLIAAYKAGGKIRVGFENSLWNADGQLAESNAQRVFKIKQAINK